MFIFNSFVIILFISVFAGGLSTESGAQVDLIEGLQVFDNSSFQGVSLVSGPNLYSPALAMSGNYRAVKLPVAVRDRVVDLLASSDEFTVMASIQHNPHNAATILAITAGSERLLEVQSSGRTDEVRFHYTRRRSEADDTADVHVESFHQPLADGLWHRLSVSVSGTQLSLYVDCVLVHSRTILPLSCNLTEFASSGRPLQLWLGQRNTQHFLLQGALQDVKFVFGSHGYLAQCPEQDSQCPSCGQFQSLQDTVDKLQHIVQQLTLRLKTTEESLKQLETCECQRSCRFNNSFHADGTSWNHDCSICACVRGEVQCRPKKCPELSCGHPYYEQGECCPKCKDGCHWSGGVYQLGDRVSVDVCTTCVCKESRMQCSSIIPDQDCPQLACSPDQRVTVTGQCCQFCRGDDYCLLTRHNCHPNATCINLQASYSCQCNPGFIGDGVTCEDVDECSAVGSPGGHHCGVNTLCVNTVGSYRCDCIPGHVRRDGYRCVERDECVDGTHVCSENAVCTNSPAGSYSCRCSTGYAGDGRSCSPVCRRKCRNGGLCMAPDRCSCRAGFAGPGCETDLDECALGVHRCSSNTRCVNMPGWYRCECRTGYRAPPLSNPVLPPSCTDVDECVEGTDTCDVRSTCVNTDGSYTCRCPDGICSRDCRVDGGTRVHGDTWQDETRGCGTCRCDDGVVTCTRTKCDCSDPHVDPICCPQCDLRGGCFHQTLSNVRFSNGDRWLHDCQQCECLMGEIDCWRMECAPVTCADPVWRPGDCCGRCPGDPCAPSSNGSITAPCHLTEPSSSHQMQPLASAVRWQTRCPECLCEVPFCDKLVDQHSSSSNRRVSWLTMVATLAVLCLLWPRCQREIHQHPLPQHIQHRRSVGRRRHLGSRTGPETPKCSRRRQLPPDLPPGPAAAISSAPDTVADGRRSDQTSSRTVSGPEAREPGAWRVQVRESSRNWRSPVIETRATRDRRASERGTREDRRTSERTSSSGPESCDKEEQIPLVQGSWVAIDRKSSAGPTGRQSQGVKFVEGVEEGDASPVVEEGDTSPVVEEGASPVVEEGDASPVVEEEDVSPVVEEGDVSPVVEEGDASPVVEEGDALLVVEDLPAISIPAHALTRPERQLLGWILIEEAAVLKTLSWNRRETSLMTMTSLRPSVSSRRHTEAPPSPRRTCRWRRHCSWSARHLCLCTATALYASQG